jgi:hypothetical protein
LLGVLSLVLGFFFLIFFVFGIEASYFSIGCFFSTFSFFTYLTSFLVEFKLVSFPISQKTSSLSSKISPTNSLGAIKNSSFLMNLIKGLEACPNS